MKAISLNPELFSYMCQFSERPHLILDRVVEETRKRDDANMQIAPNQGSFLYFLAKLINARRILEVGCFTGYSAIAMASALDDHGHLTTLDIDEETAVLAKSFFQEAGLGKKISHMLGPACDSLQRLNAELDQGEREPFDLCFIDADKTGYIDYLKKCLAMTRPGGLVVADNVLWGGSIIDHDKKDASTEALRAFNQYVKNLTGVTATMVPIADGLYLIHKN
ncbi:MAG: O-methyltransferase [Pseudobacteriovorax sp.]|nr:O-methyltransferase [Pseudobacteriovorax sp.]